MSTPTSDSHESSTSMPPLNRSRRRNVHIYDFEKPTVVLGGLILSNGVTNANFYSMLNMFILHEESFSPENEEPFLLLDERNARIDNDNCQLQPGKYYIVSISRFLHD